MKKQKLVELGADSDFDSLSFVVTYRRDNSPEYPTSAVAFMDCFNRKPLSKGWKPPPVIINRNSQRSDIYDIELGFAVNEKAKLALSKLMGLNVEFLPVEVVGERRDSSDDLKPIAKPPKLFLLNPLLEVTLGTGSVSHKMAYRQVNKYVFHPVDIVDVPIFRATEDICVLVSQSFCELVKSKGLRGLYLQNVLDWHASTERATATTKRERKPQTIEPPAIFSEKELLAASKITAPIWERLKKHWDWICDVAKLQKGAESKRPKIGKPISKEELASLQKKIGEPLPNDFSKVLVEYSAKVSFTWDIGESEFIDSLPDEFQDCSGCYSDLWDAKTIPKLAAEARKLRDCGVPSFEAAYKGRLPFIAVGNGDHIAFDMRGGLSNCPVVYLSHDNPTVNSKVLGKSFTEFLMHWSCLGCLGPDFPYFETFYDKKKKRIACESKLADRWRKLLSQGV